MKRLLGGGRMKWAHPVAKFWQAGTAVVVLAVLGTLFVAQSANAAPATSGKWLNRMYIVDNAGQNYFDTNTYDDTYQYVEQNPVDGCADSFTFVYLAAGGGADPFRNGNFFYDQSGPNSLNTLPNNFWKVQLQASSKYTGGAGGETCGTASSAPNGFQIKDNIPLSNANNRRLTFYMNGNDKIISFRSNITFSRKGDFKGVPRYFRDDEVADTNNSCPDMILLHAANINTGGESIFGRGNVAGSSMLFAVRKDDNLSRTAESYDRASEPNAVGRNGCQVEADAMNGRKSGHYGITGYDDNNHDGYYLAGGLQDDGTPATGGDEDDDTIIIFIGDMSNIPKDATGTPVTNPGNPNDGGDKIDQQTCKGGALGWVICPLVSAIQSAADLLKDTMQKMLTVNPLPLGAGQPIYEIWNNMRNFANIGFVIAFFFIIFSQATSIGISNYGIKRLLPRLVLVAIVTNLSYFICAFLVDFFNVLGVGVYNLIAIANGGSQGTVNVSNGAGAVLVGLGAAGATAAFYTGAVVQLFPLLAAAFIGMLITFIVLVVRQAGIIFLVVASPFIALAFLLDGTRQLGSKGVNVGIALLSMYPLIMLLFGGSRLAGDILTAAAQGTQLGTLVEVVGLIIQVVMGFAAIFMFKFAIVAKGALGRVAGKLNDSTKGLTGRAKDFGENRNFYQRRQFARDARKQEQRRANVEDYAAMASANTRRGHLLRRRAAGGLVGQVLNTNEAGQQRIGQAADDQLRKQRHEETQRAGQRMSHMGIEGDADLLAIANTPAGTAFQQARMNAAGVMAPTGVEVRVGEAERQAAINNLVQQGRTSQLRGLEATAARGPGGQPVTEMHRMLDEAYQEHGAKLADKAPDLMPNRRASEGLAAFTDLKPEDVTAWHHSTVDAAAGWYGSTVDARGNALTTPQINERVASRDQMLRAFSAATQNTSTRSKLSLEQVTRTRAMMNDALASGATVDGTVQNHINKMYTDLGGV